MVSGMLLSKINLTGRRASSPGARNCSSKQKHSNFFKYSFALLGATLGTAPVSYTHLTLPTKRIV